MLKADLDLLRSHRAWPSVSLIAPPDPRVMASLRQAAKQRLLDLYVGHWPELVSGLDQAERSIRGTGAPAVALYANQQCVHAVELPRAAPPRVVIDETFATRDLVIALARTRRYLVLELDGSQAWLWAGLGQQLQPVVNDGLLVELSKPPTPSGRTHHQERSQHRQAHTARSLRAVAAALSAVVRSDDVRPLFIVGSPPIAQQFSKMVGHQRRPATAIAGATTHQPPALQALLENHLVALDTRRQQDAMSEVEAVSARTRFCSGLAETWAAANLRRVELLIVEETFAAPAHEHLSLQKEAVHRASGPLDDLVDELIEAVLDGGGRFEPVDDGSLPQSWERVAAKLRH